MPLRMLALASSCALCAVGGYQVSVLRASAQPFMPVEDGAMMAAGDEAGLVSSSEGESSAEGYRLSSLSVFSNVAIHVKDNYVDPERIGPKEMLLAALEGVERQVAEVLVEQRPDGRVSVKAMAEEKLVELNDVESLWEINLKLRDVFRFLEQTLPPQKDLRAIEYAAVNGALSTLDPHSVLLKPEAFAEMKTSTKGEFGGLGIVISVRDNRLTIISPIDGTPASRAGLKTGDVIARIGEVSTVSMNIEEAVRMLRGPEGSKVTIWVDRKGWPESKKFVMARERIKIESVESELLSLNVGYIKIKNFQQNTGKDLEDQLDALKKKAGGKLSGVVLDLRNNPGGLLEQAIRVSDKFLTSGDIVTTVGYGNKLREPKRARWSGTEADLPVAVLVNQGSASASEIVAGALKNLDRAVIVGERTFGKGSVQVLYDFADSSALKLTIAQYLTPGGISIQNEGVAPDIALRPAWLEEKGVRLYYEPEGQREQSLDKHLDRAGEGPGAQQPAHELTYLWERKAEEPAAAEDEAPSEEAPKGEQALEEDYPIRFARDLLVSVGAPTRSRMVEAGKRFVDERRAEEERRIVERMRSLGLDWSVAPGEVRADTLRAELKLELEGKAGGQVTAGDEVKLIATVRNTGAAPIHRVHATLDSEHPAFEGRELLFGRLGPGESRTWSVPTKIPKDAPSRSDLIKVRLQADGVPFGDESALAVATRQVPHPQFAYSYVFDDAERGDGDGVLESGEGVDFVVLVTNTGPGDADDVSLRLKSDAGEELFLERGRATVGVLKSGETRTARMKFHLPKAPLSREALPLELTIYDSSTGEWLEDQFAVVPAPAVQTRAVARKGGATLKRDALVYAGSSSSSPVIGWLKKGVRLNTTTRLEDLVQVELEPQLFGWVKAADLGPGARSKEPALGQLSVAPGRRPPTIEVAGELGGRVVEEERFELTGRVTGRGLRDVYVLLNDEKVYFTTPSASAPAKASALLVGTWRPPAEDGVALPLRVSLKLKEGLNRVLVVARLDDKVVSYKSLYVSRRGATPPAVAERAPERTPPEAAAQ
jgi:carboxyl-terminal processing protease